MQPGVSRRQQAAADYARRNTLNNYTQLVTSSVALGETNVEIQRDKDRRFSSLSILEHLGETDPEATIKEWMQAQFPYETYKAYNELRRLGRATFPTVIVKDGDVVGNTDAGSGLINWRTNDEEN